MVASSIRHGPLVVRNPAGGGRRVETYAHLLGGAPPGDGSAAARSQCRDCGVGGGTGHGAAAWNKKSRTSRHRVEELTAMVQHLRSDLGAE